MNIDLKEKALATAKELYPEAPIDELLITASKLEIYFAAQDQMDSLPIFASNCFIQHPVKGNINFVPYRAQLEALLTIQHQQHTLIHASRQTGSTMLMCMAILWEALRKSNQTIMVLGRTFMQVQEMKNTIEYTHRHLMGIFPKISQYDKSSITFDNGSRIICRAATEHALRGMTIDALYIDNTGFISHSTLYDIWQSAAPMLIRNGRVVLVHSGRCMDDGLFHELWQSQNNMAKIKLHWSDHPDRDSVWEKDMRAQFGNDTFDAEFECVFTPKPN